VQLEIALRDQPLAAQFCNRSCRIERVRQHFAVDRGDTVDLTREPTLDEACGHQTHIARMTRIDVTHGRAVEQRLAAGGHAHCGGDIDQLEHLRCSKALELACGNTGTNHPIRAVRMDAQLHIRGATDARGHLIT
jgi:hypothetical protein